MLAGLLFADREALDRPGQLTATLPFGGVSLIEYQARLLIAAGASQLIVSVGRLTPELLGALARIGRRGVAVDAVRSAAEASEKLHPLSRVLMLADGLITTQDVVDAMAQQTADVLLVASGAEVPAEYERLGGGMAWAGVAKLDPRRIAEVAALPRDYDLQSTTLRLAEQARAAHLPIPGAALHDGHGIEHSSAGMAGRGRAVLAAMVADRSSAINTLIVAPLARLSIPSLVERGIATALVAGAGLAVSLAGIVAIVMGAPRSGTLAAFIGCLVLAVGELLARLRDEPGIERAQYTATTAAPALTALAAAFVTEDVLAIPLTLMLLFTAGLGVRATRRAARRPWWGSPLAYLTVLTIFVLAGHALTGIAMVMLYAAVTATMAVESLRQGGIGEA